MRESYARLSTHVRRNPMVRETKGLPSPPFKPDRTYRGLPVPFTILWREGKDRPSFDSLDSDRVVKALRESLCAICGRRFTSSKRVWAGGYHDPLPDDTWFLDPPMHQECAEYAIAACPYLAGERVRDGTPDGYMPDAKPKALYIGIGVRRQGLMTRPKRLRRIVRLEGLHDIQT